MASQDCKKYTIAIQCFLDGNTFDHVISLTPPYRFSVLRLTSRLCKSSFSSYIVTIRQMRRVDDLSILADVVTCVTNNTNFVTRDISNRQFLIRISKCYDRVDELRSSGVRLEDLGGIVDDLSTLRIATDAEFGFRALLHCLLDELSKILAATNASSGTIISRSCWVVVDTLYGNIVCSERLLQRKNERWTDDASNVACLGSSTSKEEGERLADAVHNVVPSHTDRRYTLTASDCACNFGR